MKLNEIKCAKNENIILQNWFVLDKKTWTECHKKEELRNKQCYGICKENEQIVCKVLMQLNR